MSHNILEGKKGIIFGALDDQSIAWKTAESVKNEGGKFVLTNAPVALRMGAINETPRLLGQSRRSLRDVPPKLCGKRLVELEDAV